jgi:hypothetical protein
MIPLFIEQIITRFQQGKIVLKIDPALQNGIGRNYQGNPLVDFGFSLFDLVCAIGACKTVANTKANKFPLASDYLRIFKRNNLDELRLVVTDDHTIEQKQEAARYIGEGLSRIIAEKLYSLEKNSITRIERKGKQSKPDFRGNRGDFKVVWEAKGSISAIRKKTIKKAKTQKKLEPANIAFASFATLKPQKVVEVSIQDPPSLPLEGEDLKRKLSKVNHYVKTFNFIGQAKLSRYFELMGKRLEKDKDFREFDEKTDLFQELRDRSIRTLLTVQGFVGFVGYEDFPYEQPGNTFRITSDGICYGYLRNLHNLRELGLTREIDVEKVPYYRDTLSIRDLDSMLSFQLVEHIGYLFERENFEVETEDIPYDKGYDLIVIKETKKFFVEVKKRLIESIRQLKFFRFANVSIVVTIANVSEDFIRKAKELNIVILDRKALKKIIKRQEKISNFFE